MPSVEYWISQARVRLRALLEAEHAVVWDEVEAKISDPPKNYVEPHHLTTARQLLRDSGEIVEPIEATRGGRPIGVLHYADTARRQTAIMRAARRKRLLHARYLGWTAPSARYPHGRIGPAAEQVTHRSLLAAAPHGFRLLNPTTGAVTSIFGSPVPGGPLDNGAYLTVIDDQRAALQPILLPIEVKNTRHWIYTQHRELHQVLYKAASLTLAEPAVPVVPVLVCRRRQYQTRQLGIELGCYVIETRRQPLLPSDIDENRLDEVRTELGYSDLTLTDESDPNLVKAFEALPRYAVELADRWAKVGCHLIEHYRDLRNSSLREGARWRAFEELRMAARELGCNGSWCGDGQP